MSCLWSALIKVSLCARDWMVAITPARSFTQQLFTAWISAWRSFFSCSAKSFQVLAVLTKSVLTASNNTASQPDGSVGGAWFTSVDPSLERGSVVWDFFYFGGVVHRILGNRKLLKINNNQRTFNVNEDIWNGRNCGLAQDPKPLNNKVVEIQLH